MYITFPTISMHITIVGFVRRVTFLYMHCPDKFYWSVVLYRYIVLYQSYSSIVINNQTIMVTNVLFLVIYLFPQSVKG